MTTYDKIAAALIAAVLSLFPVLKLAGVSMSGDDLAAIQLCLGAFSTAGGLVWQAVQHKAPPSGP